MISHSFAAIHLAHETVVEELRWFGGFGFRCRFGEKIQYSLKSGFGRHELAAEAGFLIKLVTAVENVLIGFFGVFAEYFHGERFIGVVAVDTRSDGSQQRHETRTEL